MILHEVAFEGLAPINVVKEVLIHIQFNINHRYQECGKLVCSADPDETPLLLHLVWVYAVSKWSLLNFLNVSEIAYIGY